MQTYVTIQFLPTASVILSYAGQDRENVEMMNAPPYPSPRDTHPHKHYINLSNDSGTSTAEKKINSGDRKSSRGAALSVGQRVQGTGRELLAQSALGADSDHTSHRHEHTGICRGRRPHQRLPSTESAPPTAHFVSDAKEVICVLGKCNDENEKR